MQSIAEEIKKRLDAHVDQAAKRAGGIACVDGGEHQVAGERGLDSDVGRFAVADLPDHDHVWVGAQHRAQTAARK